MEELIGEIILLACGAVIFCMGALNGRWFVLMRGSLAHASPLTRLMPQVVVRVVYACVGLVVMTLAGLMLMGMDLRSPDVVTIEVDGAPEIRLVGFVKADDEEGTFAGSLPNAVSARGRSVSYAVENVGDAGPMTVTILINGYLRETMTADKEHPVLRGTVIRGRVSQSAEQKQHR